MTGYILVLTLTFYNPITTSGIFRNEIRTGSVATVNVATEKACNAAGWDWVSKQKNDTGELRRFNCYKAD